jgi:hypothetical protein
MARKGDFWAKDMAVGGTKKPVRFKEKVESGYQEFWAKRGAGGACKQAAATDAKW